MFLRTLQLTHFKSYTSASFQFHSPLVAITGRNGSGKTNLLDALHHLSLARSAFHKQDSQNIEHEADFYRIDATIEAQEKQNRLELTYSSLDKKKIKWNQGPVERITDHVGRLPLVLILPDEPFQMNESSEWRRNFFDNVLCQAFPPYLQALHLYKRLLAQRNATLKYFADHQRVDLDLLESIDTKMHMQAEILNEVRSRHIPELSTLVLAQSQWIAANSEEVRLERRTDLDQETHVGIFKRNLHADLESQRTNGGIHKDDYSFLLNSRSLKKTGSQGQQKTFLLALKLAQYRFLQKYNGQNPWLLMDDIFDKLDDLRIRKLVELVSNPGMGQVFLTDARPERSRDLLAGCAERVQWIHIER